MDKLDPRKVMTVMLKEVHHQGVYGMGINTRQVAEALGVTYNTAMKALKTLESEKKVIHVRAGKYSHWKVNFKKIEEVDGDTEFMLNAQDCTQIQPAYKIDDFQWASMLSMMNNCTRPTMRPGDVEDPIEQEFMEEGYTIFYP